MVTPAARRSAVAHVRELFGLSERRACCIVGISRRAALTAGNGEKETARTLRPAVTTKWIPDVLLQ